MRLIEAEAGSVCCRPECANPTHRESINGDAKARIGEAAHIHSGRPNGPRFDPALTTRQIRDSSNGIWLCQSCHTTIDDVPEDYPPGLLKEWKVTRLLAMQKQLMEREIFEFQCPFCGDFTDYENQSVCKGNNCGAHIYVGPTQNQRGQSVSLGIATGFGILFLSWSLLDGVFNLDMQKYVLWLLGFSVISGLVMMFWLAIKEVGKYDNQVVFVRNDVYKISQKARSSIDKVPFDL